MIDHSSSLHFLIFISSIISVVYCTLDLATPEVYILDASGNERRSNDFAVTVNSGLSLICRTSSALSVSQPFYWQYSVFGEQNFVSVPSSLHLSINQNRLGEVTLKLIKVVFSLAGTYRCTDGIVSRSVNIHIYGVEMALGDSVRLVHKSDVIGSFHFQVATIDSSSRPTAACKFRVGRNGIKYTSVRWKGGLYQANPALYEVSYEADQEDGTVWTNLTIKHPTVDQDLYGKYYCLFNVITGQMVSAEVEITIPPLVDWQQVSVDRYLETGSNFTCPVIAYPPVSSPIVWLRDGVPLLSHANGTIDPTEAVQSDPGNGRVRLATSRLPNDLLSFTDIQAEDRATYACFVETALGNATGAFYLRVKNRLAILWPIVGITFELVILFAVILVYECKQRAKRRQEATEIPGPSDRFSSDLKTSGYDATADKADFHVGYTTGAAGDEASGYRDASLLRQRPAKF